MTTDQLRTLTVERDAGIAIVEFTRPDLANRFDDEQHVELTRVVDAVSADRSIRSIVLAARGPYFSAGGSRDLILAANRSLPERLRIVDNGRRLLEALLGSRCPIVVALQGDASGLGATVALSGSAVVAARTAGIADPHVVVGLVAGDGGAVLWPSHVGALTAKRYLLTGDRMPAEVAFQLGLVTDLVDDPSEVRDVAVALARRIAALPPLAVQMTHRTLNRGLLQRAGEVFELGLAHEAVTLGSNDLVVALDAASAGQTGIYNGE